MGKQWNKKHALITGSTAGLGRHFAHCCTNHGMDVTLVARDSIRLQAEAERLATLAPGCQINPLVADLSEPGGATEVVKQANASKPIDLICHCAGRSSRGRIVDATREDFDSLLKINFLAAAELASAAAEGLADRKGHLVLIGSLATYTAPPMLGAYAASKHPLAALAQQLRLEMGPDGLHTLLVCPGPIARDDAGNRYDKQTKNLPDSAKLPGGGAKLKAIDPNWLSERILSACEKRQTELVVPSKARLLFVLSRLSPSLGDWLLSRSMKK